ncbi:MAG: hypothetical protein ACTSRW_17070 [Candidatus Helarchaeota archaeon]
MSNYTKGKWEWSTGDPLLKNYGIYSVEGERIAEVLNQNEANARLIAAAPELLDALKAWQKYDSESGDKHPCPDYALRIVYREDARKLTEAAIAQAEKGHEI